MAVRKHGTTDPSPPWVCYVVSSRNRIGSNLASGSGKCQIRGSETSELRSAAWTFNRIPDKPRNSKLMPCGCNSDVMLPETIRVNWEARARARLL